MPDPRGRGALLGRRVKSTAGEREMKSIAQLVERVGWTKWDAAAHGRSLAVNALTRGFDWIYTRAVGGVPGLEGAAELAATYAARHTTTDAAVRALIQTHSGMAGAAGFVTGCGGFVATAVALPANLASALYIQVRLVAAIAHMRGHDIHSAEVRVLVLGCLTGSKAADTLKDVGVRFGTRLTRDVLGWAAPVLFNKARHTALPSASVVGHTAGRFGRFVPVIGGFVAGGVDALMTQLIGRTADRVFSRSALSGRCTGAQLDRPI